jgi:Fe-S-cluster containining protein
VPADVERIARYLGYTNVGEFAFDNLLASPGATVMNAEGHVFQIPTLVPQRKTDGSCKFLSAEGHCSIHAVSPYGCAMFDAHQSSEEADRRSSRGLQEVARHWSARVGTSAYAVVWKLLYTVGLRAIPAHIARMKMEEAVSRAENSRLVPNVIQD